MFLKIVFNFYRKMRIDISVIFGSYHFKYESCSCWRYRPCGYQDVTGFRGKKFSRYGIDTGSIRTICR